MSNAEIVAAIYGVGGTIFLAGFLVAVVTTGARTIWYLRHRGQALPPLPAWSHVPEYVAMPRLLTRDIIVKGGMFISFGLIAALRFLPPEDRVAFTSGNVAWALLTTLPAVIAICVYDYFEMRVIPRAR